jgi:outer membrane biosynthesis protein TonB
VSFWDRFESNREGIEDTIEFTIRTAVVTLAAVILVVVIAMVAGMFVSNEIVSSEKVFEIIGPAFNTIVGAFVGLLGGLSLNANARDKKPEEPAPIEPEPLPAPEPEPEPAPMAAAPEPEAEDDDDMAPWEKYRNDLRYDANGDGVVDEDDFPDWRNPRA